MSIFKGAMTLAGAFAGASEDSTTGAGTLRGFISAYGMASSLLILTTIVSLPSWGAVNVSIPVSLQTEFIQNTTSQYFGILTKSQNFADTYSFSITGKKPVVLPPPTTAIPCTLDETVQKIVEITTNSYVYGYRDGEQDERDRDLSMIGGYIVRCSSPTYFGVSSSTWNNGTCGTALMAPSQDIYQQNFSTPTILQ